MLPLMLGLKCKSARHTVTVRVSCALSLRAQYERQDMAQLKGTEMLSLLLQQPM